MKDNKFRNGLPAKIKNFILRDSIIGLIRKTWSLEQKKRDGENISYQYDLYDFDEVKLYEKPKINLHGVFGKFEELKAVEDALRYLNPGEETTLLVPSVLAFGTYGDGKEIPNDMPLIIKLKVLQD